ncbi:MAG: hypothetical protein QW112_01415 [Candidatus Micrarchaeia archaeon]
MAKFKPPRKKIVPDKFRDDRKLQVYSRLIKYSKKEDLLVVADIGAQTLEDFASKKRKIRWRELWPFMFVYANTLRLPVSGSKLERSFDKGFIYAAGYWIRAYSANLLLFAKSAFESIRRKDLIKGMEEIIDRVVSFVKTFGFFAERGKIYFYRRPHENVKRLMSYTNQVCKYVTGDELDREARELFHFCYSKLVRKYMDENLSVFLVDDGFPWHVTARGFIDLDRIGYLPLPFGVGCAFGFHSIYSKIKNPHLSFANLFVLLSSAREEAEKQTGLRPMQFDMDFFTNGVYFWSFYNNVRMASHLSKNRLWHHTPMTEEETKNRIIEMLDTMRKQINTLALFDRHAKMVKWFLWRIGIFNTELFPYRDDLVADAELDISFDIPAEVKGTDNDGNEIKFTRMDVVNDFIHHLRKDFVILRMRIKGGIHGIADAGLLHMRIRSTLSKMRALEDICFGPTNKTYISSFRHLLPKHAIPKKNYERHIQKISRPDETRLAVDAYVYSNFVDMISIRNVKIIGSLRCTTVAEETEGKRPMQLELGFAESGDKQLEFDFGPAEFKEMMRLGEK